VQTVAAHPPLSVAITTIGVIAVAMVGSTISSQLVDLEIAGGLGVLTVVAALVANNDIGCHAQGCRVGLDL
jgi:hypothetical protein